MTTFEVTNCDLKNKLRLARTLAPPESVLRPGQFFLEIDNFFYLNQELAVDLSEVEDLVNGEAGAEQGRRTADSSGFGNGVASPARQRA